MVPTWALSAPDGPHVGPINLAIEVEVKFDYIKTVHIDRMNYLLYKTPSKYKLGNLHSDLFNHFQCELLCLEIYAKYLVVIM